MDKKRYCWLHPEAIAKHRSNFFDWAVTDDALRNSLVWDDDDPQYVFVGEHLYTDKTIYEKFVKLYTEEAAENRVFIFAPGESLSPDMNLFDYAIGFDVNLQYMPITWRKTPFQTFFGTVSQNDISREEARSSLSGRKFCNFIYGNSRAHKMRDCLFYKISEYKRVDSLGSHLNNVPGSKQDRTDKDWMKSNILQKSGYKFSIACENERREGYATEKLLTSFMAHTVPIYWGDPKITERFNPKAFINVNDYDNLDDLLKVIEEIDHDDERWLDMVTQPWQTDEQMAREADELERLKNGITRILGSKISDVKRRPDGFWKNNYFYWFMNRYHVPKHRIRVLVYRLLPKRLAEYIRQRLRSFKNAVSRR